MELTNAQQNRLIVINKTVNSLCSLSHEWFKDLKAIHKEVLGEKIAIKEMRAERDCLVNELHNEALYITKNIAFTPVVIPMYLSITKNE